MTNAAAVGEPEDQLRAPFEQLVCDVAVLLNFPAGAVVTIGETALTAERSRPDYSVALRNALTGFVELKSPGKGADPRKFKGHDKQQWLRLQSLPNLIYSDGNAFSLWRDGELALPIVRLAGDIETSGAALGADHRLTDLFEAFFSWSPIAPSSALDLAKLSARLCRLLRDDVTEALARNSEALTTLASDWRDLLFPSASDEQFADGYAQAVTFGLLMARARGISVSGELHQVSSELQSTSSLIGTALQLLTDSAEARNDLSTSLPVLQRVLEGVHWAHISRGRADAWLYFYEEFLEVYDNTLRKQTGSYYTPPEVVSGMVRLVDDVLRRPGFALTRGIAATEVTVADPATGTGTFVLGVLRHIAATVAADEGSGAVGPAVAAAMQRIIAFELQLGPFAVAQLRVLAEAVALTGLASPPLPRMFVTDTLSNPHDDGGRFPGFLAPIGRQRRAANVIKRDEPIMVVIGNPPYKEKAKGRGGWVEGEGRNAGEFAPLDAWMPPTAWGVGTHAKHLRNLYVYFWRWAAWKVFEQPPHNGIVAFITVAGFLNGPGFEAMRASLRRRCDEIWVIDASPEGHQPEVATRLFQGVQQPVCIVLAARWRERPAVIEGAPEALAAVRWRALPEGHRQQKFEALAALSLSDAGWVACPSDARAPFLPAAAGAWAGFPKLEDLFAYNGSGVMPGRTWVIAPDAVSLQRRWAQLVAANPEDKERWFHPHLRNGKPGDKHVDKVVAAPLSGFTTTGSSVADDRSSGLLPSGYGFRSFDRQWIIPDARLINQPNPQLWAMQSDRQVFLTAPADRSPSSGPAIAASGLVPDLHHYNGRGGRVFPLWADRDATRPNLEPALLAFLSAAYGRAVSAEDLFGYIVALAAHPGYVARFAADLATPGLRIPLTTDAALFTEAAALGRRVVWLHTFGERMADAGAGRPPGPPRLPPERRPGIPAGGAIPSEPEHMPDLIEHEALHNRLRVGSGYIENVPVAVWRYEVSGKQVLTQWFSYRRKNRERPIMGDRRPPSPLGAIQPEGWLAEYTTELLNVLNVLGLLVELEPAQATLLGRICDAGLFDASALLAAGAFASAAGAQRRARSGETATGTARLEGFD